MSSLSRIVRAQLRVFFGLPKSIWAVFSMQIILRAGDFVFPFLTLFLTRKLGLGGAEAGLWIMLNVISGLAGTMVAGQLSDRLGRKRVLGAAMAGSGLLTGLCAFLPPSLLIPKVLVAGSFFQGSVKPVISALIMDLAPSDRRKEAFSLSYLGINIGVAVGPMMAGFLFERHLSWIFLGNITAVSAALLVLRAFIPLRPPREHNLASSREKASTGGAFKVFLGRPNLVLFGVTNLFLAFAYSQTNFGLTLYTSTFFGSRGAEVFGFLMSFNAIVVVSTTTVLTRLVRHLSGPTTMALGTLCYTLGFGMLGFRLGFVPLALSTFVWTLGEILMATNSGAYLAGHTPVNLRGRFQSFLEMSSATGRTLSPLVCGAIVTGAGIRASWLLTSLVTLACTASFALLTSWERRGAEPPAGAAPNAPMGVTQGAPGGALGR